MRNVNRQIAVGTAAAALALCFAAPASAQGWSPGRWDWSAGRGDSRPYALRGPGVRLLLPELRDTRRGHAFVLRNFDYRRDGFITPREADDANRAFLDAVGSDRARFDWRIVDLGPDRGPPPMARAHRWDRAAMRGYGFRDTAEGARLTLQEDVLFRTDSAELRPGAIDKLETLADYLRDNPGVRVAIDGYTDSRGTDAHNQDLSERRSASVRDAFDRLGVTEARFRVRGHGEADPVAPNTTPENMRRNRRVEITLLGRRAGEFN